MAVTNFKNSSIITGTKRTRVWDQSSAPGNFYSISTVTIGSTEPSSIEFTNIPQTYTHLQIRGIVRSSQLSSGGFSDMYMQFNSDTTTNYQVHYLQGNGATASSGASASSTSINGRAARNDATASVFTGNIIDILDYTSANKRKTVRLLEGSDHNGSGGIGLRSGAWRNTTDAITSIKFTLESSSNFKQYSTFALYGVL